MIPRLPLRTLAMDEEIAVRVLSAVRTAKGKSFREPIPVIEIEIRAPRQRRVLLSLADPVLEARIRDLSTSRDGRDLVGRVFRIRRVPLSFAAHVDAPSFTWPTTDVAATRAAAVEGLVDVDWRSPGVLGLSGYRVGKTNGQPRDIRERILNTIFLVDDLRDIGDRSYAEEWGLPRSEERLKKMAEAIAAFTRNAKYRRRRAYATAIREWEQDLKYLKRSFYDGWGSFPWPHTSVKRSKRS